MELKRIQTFKRHEGELLYQANIYLKGKMIGYWSQDFWNGPDYIEIKDDYTYEKIIKTLKEINKENYDFLNTEPELSEEDFLLHSNDCLNCILHNLITLHEWEKKYKHYSKKHEKVTLGIATDGYSEYYYGFYEKE